MSKREATKKANREALLASARRVFGTIGYDAATVRDIVRGSGLATGSFYNYFPDKAAVFQAVVEETLGELNGALTAARRSATDAEGFLAGAYVLVTRVAVEDPERAALIGRNQTRFRQMFYQAEVKSAIQRDLEQDLRDWVAAGRFVEHDVPLMAEGMISLGMDLLVQCSLDPSTAEARVAFLVELFSRALLPPQVPSVHT